MSESERFTNGDKVIIRVRADESANGVDEFYAGYVCSPRTGQKLQDPTNYYIQVIPNDLVYDIHYREVTFYDIMPYHKFHLQDLGWESQTAARAMRHMHEMWGLWYTNGYKTKQKATSTEDSGASS